MYDVFYTGTKPNLFAHEQPADSIEQAQLKSRTRYFWWVSYLSDYSTWDWLWEPTPWQSHQRHAWPSQCQPDSGTYLVPKDWNGTETNYHSEPRIVTRSEPAWWTYPDGYHDLIASHWHPDGRDPPFIYQFGTQHQITGGPVYRVPGATAVKYVSDHRIVVTSASSSYMIDHMDGNVMDSIDSMTPRSIPKNIVRFANSYLETLKRIAARAEDEYIWITSSVCDYTNFDFTWHPDAWQAQALHVFHTRKQKFGDTFFMHVPSFQNNIEQFELLEWYNLNFLPSPHVCRWPPPERHHKQESQVEEVKKHDFKSPYVLFLTNNAEVEDPPEINLWRPQTRSIMQLTPDASAVLVPREAKPQIKTQLYDYALIDRSHVKGEPAPLDIVFLSNGEKCAQENYQHLVNLNLPNRVIHIEGVNGRVASQYAAANSVNTDFYFVVPAKLQVKSDFDWLWQPDRMQQAKHTIFHALNPHTQLCYGHMAAIAYCRRLVLETQGVELDFTLEQPHAVVPMLSGIANFDQDPHAIWRTAFREVTKLLYYQSKHPDVDTEYRIDCWLNHNTNAHSQRGAHDAKQYFDSVNGDFEALRKTYDWNWFESVLPAQSVVG